MTWLFGKIESILDSITDFIDGALSLASLWIDKFLESSKHLTSYIFNRYEDLSDALYTVFRYSTIPINYIIGRTWLWYVFRGDQTEPLDATGVHMIQAEPGGGKSMLAFQKSNEIARDTGYTSYHTSAIERPRLSDDGKWWEVLHRLINLKSYYKGGKKVKQFNTELYKSLWVDEFHYLNNPRLNKTNDYNHFFIPFLNDLIFIRHEGFDNNIYLLTQVPTNDIQVMSMLVFYHRVQLKKGFSYIRWIKTGKFEITPLYWRISSYKIDHNNNMKKIHYRTWKKKVDIDELEYFDTHAMKNEFSHLPLDYK